MLLRRRRCRPANRRFGRRAIVVVALLPQNIVNDIVVIGALVALACYCAAANECPRPRLAANCAGRVEFVCQLETRGNVRGCARCWQVLFVADDDKGCGGACLCHADEFEACLFQALLIGAVDDEDDAVAVARVGLP